MENKRLKGLYKLITVVQICMVIGLITLEKLCYERALVMRHTYTRKVMYLSSIWQQNLIYVFLLGVVLFATFTLMHYRFVRKKDYFRRIVIVESLLMVAGAFFLLLVDKSQLYVYAYALNSMVIILLLYILKYNIISNVFDRNDKIFIQM